MLSASEAIDPPDTSTVRLEALYRSHGRDVRRWAQRLGGPGFDADDATQEVFLVLQSQLTRIDGCDGFRTWLYRTTLNVVRHQRRKRRWMGLIGLDTLPEGELERTTDSSNVEAELMRKEQVRELYRVLDKLPEIYRTTLILHELEGLSGPEIATICNTAESTVWVRLHRARKLFLETLAQVRARKEQV